MGARAMSAAIMREAWEWQWRHRQPTEKSNILTLLPGVSACLRTRRAQERPCSRMRLRRTDSFVDHRPKPTEGTTADIGQKRFY